MSESPVTLPTLLVFADDWGRHPSSCQPLVRRLLGRYQVCWVNTVGMRPPRPDWATFRRGLEKVSQWLGRPHSARDSDAATGPPSQPSPAAGEGQGGGPRVLNPRMWP